MGKFDGKVVIVTGSSAGIGRGTALLLAEQGATLTITGRSAERLEETRQLILKAGGKEEKILPVIADISSEEDIKQIIAETVNKFGKLDVLVNNAGAAPECDIYQPLTVFDSCINQNLRGVVALCKEAIPHLKKTKGNIVNVSSTGAFQAEPALAYYCIAKAGLDQFTRILALQLAADGIRANILHPGSIRTNILPKEVWDEMEASPYVKECTPIPRLGLPIEMAHAISFLASNEEASYITGQNIVADGGFSINTPKPPIEFKEK